MTADLYLQNILAREGVDTGVSSPVRGVMQTIQPIIGGWAGAQLVGVNPSGSFAKGTANHSGTDIDLFISLKADTTNTLKEIYESLLTRMTGKGYSPRRQNVSLHIQVNGYEVDLVPAKRQAALGDDHSLYHSKKDTWTKTNVTTHIAHVVRNGRINESRIIKLWRNQKGLDFPSFYLELTVIAALIGQHGSLSSNVWKVFEYLRDSFVNARVVDPANTNNIISDDLTGAERTAVRTAALQAIHATDWNQIVR